MVGHLPRLGFLVAIQYPPVFSLWLLVLGFAALAFRRRKIGFAIICIAFAWTFAWSVPACSEWLRNTLERQQQTPNEPALPKADAIVVLGGGSYEWLDHNDIGPEELVNSRLAAGARAWLAGRAPLVVLSGGGSRVGHTEALRMAKVIGRWGVPPTALLLEQRSRNTKGNALYTGQLMRERGLHRVLLVTSSLHMPRASLLFRNAGMQVIPVPVPEPDIPQVGWRERLIPSRRALWASGRAIKEYLGLIDVMVDE